MHEQKGEEGNDDRGDTGGGQHEEDSDERTKTKEGSQGSVERWI